jgi:hypothetical protein
VIGLILLKSSLNGDKVLNRVAASTGQAQFTRPKLGKDGETDRDQSQSHDGREAAEHCSSSL